MASVRECSICLEIFREPKFLQCHHTFCKECILDQINNCQNNKRTEIVCPLCRVITPIPDGDVNKLQTNFYLNQSILQHQMGSDAISLSNGSVESDLLNTNCSICDSHSIGRCESCDLSMCLRCKNKHVKDDRFYGHIFNDFQQRNTITDDLGQGRQCEHHPGKPLQFYCIPCSKMMCRLCKDFHIRSKCFIVAFEEAASQFRKKLEELINKKKVGLLLMVHKQCTLELERVSTVEKIEERIDNVCKFVENLQHKLQQFAEILIQTLRDEKSQFDDQMKQKIEGHVGIMDKLKSDLEMPIDILTNASDHDVIDLSRTIIVLLKRIKIMQEDDDGDMSKEKQKKGKAKKEAQKKKTPKESEMTTEDVIKGFLLNEFICDENLPKKLLYKSIDKILSDYNHFLFTATPPPM